MASLWKLFSLKRILCHFAIILMFILQNTSPLRLGLSRSIEPLSCFVWSSVSGLTMRSAGAHTMDALKCCIAWSVCVSVCVCININQQCTAKCGVMLQCFNVYVPKLWGFIENGETRCDTSDVYYLYEEQWYILRSNIRYMKGYTV